MATWTETMHLLRADYLRDGKANVDAVSRLVERLELETCPETLPDLTRRFHGLAGSGFTYGFPEVSALGRRGETACKAVADRDGLPLPADLSEWHLVVSGLRREFGLPPRPEGADFNLAQQASARPQVLVVDDDDTVRTILTRVLETDGMNVLPAGTRAEALRHLLSGLPDAMLVDVRLPDGLGYGLVEHLRALPGGTRVPVLVMSVLAELSDRVEAVHCGADGFFGKPVNWDQLRARLQQLLARRRPRRDRVLVAGGSAAPDLPLEASLNAAGYEVRSCADLAQVDSAVSVFAPDLVLADLVGRSGSGREVVLQLQGSGREDLPVLVLSTEASPILLDGAADRTEVLPAHLPSERLLSVVATHLERGRMIRRLQEQDGLTGLLNYTAFHERARALLAGPVTRAAYLLIDVDGLARINERHGYRAGDKVLAKLAGLLRKRVRYSDVLGRLGGQHFAILLEDLGEAEAVRLADRLCAEFAKAQQVASDGSAFSARITVGVAAIDGVAATPEELAEAAASALHCSKDANRGSRAVHATAAPRPLAPLAAASSESAAAQLSAPALVGSSRAGSVRELAERPSDQSTVEEWKALAAVDGAGWGEAGRVALPR